MLDNFSDIKYRVYSKISIRIIVLSRLYYVYIGDNTLNYLYFLAHVTEHNAFCYLNIVWHLIIVVCLIYILFIYCLLFIPNYLWKSKGTAL